MRVIENVVYVSNEDIIDGKLKIDANVSCLDNIIADNDLVKEIEILPPISNLSWKIFSRFNHLEKVILPDTIKELPGSLFYCCRELKEVVLPKNLKRLGAACFVSCQKLKKVELPDTIKQIMDKTFSGCGELEEIKLPKNLEFIGEGVFSDCVNLGHIDLPDSIKEIHNQAFSSCGIEEINLPKNLERVSDSLFEKCKNLKKIKIPSNIKSIGDRAFSWSNLEEIIFEEGIEVIESSAFANCFELTSCSFPKSLKSIYHYAFCGCVKLENITFNNGLKTIGRYSFSECVNLKEVKLPDSLTSLQDGTFLNCEKLKEVKLSTSLGIIEDYTFQGCVSLERIEIPSNVKHIEKSVFEGCKGLKEVILNEGLEEIKRAVFSYCTSLEKINLPQSLRNWSSSAFLACSSLKRIVIPNNITYIPTALFDNCRNLKEVILGEKIEIISRLAFCRCKSLKEISIPKSVKKIQEYAFEDCENLSQISLYNQTNITYNYETTPVEFIVKNEKSNVEKHLHLDYLCSVISSEGFLFLDEHNNCYFFDCDGNWIESSKSEICKRIQDKALYSDYIRFYEWKKRKKFIPSAAVFKTMPIKEIGNFYVNGNYKRWHDISELANVSNADKIGLFKLCYVMGLFNSKGSISIRAYQFLKEKIKSFNSSEYHVLFYDLDIESYGYNEEFTRLILNEYDKCDDNDSSSLDGVFEGGLFGLLYNNFELIKRMYPNKKVKTNRRSEELTLDMCLDVVKSVRYYNVEEGNEEFAKNVGRYGYSQEVFTHAQKLFDQGKRLDKEEITLLIGKDDDNELITYELLDKDNPLGVVLGDITNCCQTLTGVASSCVEYGLSKPNSKFMAFRMNNKIIGQSWVWYDEVSKKICLDNIEIPTAFLKTKMKEKVIQEAFLKCLKRSVNGFLKAMENKGLEVNSITIGEGYNDIDFLLEGFERVEDQPLLSDYSGYSDASNQYVLYSK